MGMVAVEGCMFLPLLGFMLSLPSVLIAVTDYPDILGKFPRMCVLAKHWPIPGFWCGVRVRLGPGSPP